MAQLESASQLKTASGSWLLFQKQLKSCVITNRTNSTLACHGMQLRKCSAKDIKSKNSIMGERTIEDTRKWVGESNYESKAVFPKQCAAAHWCAVEDFRCAASPFKMLFVVANLPKSRKCCHYRPRREN